MHHIRFLVVPSTKKKFRADTPLGLGLQCEQEDVGKADLSC